LRQKQYVYIFDCVRCYGFYGEQVLTQEGKLLCPECLGEQEKDSPYVEKMRVHREVGFFDPSEVERKLA
jgi:hypothetical protein